MNSTKKREKEKKNRIILCDPNGKAVMPLHMSNTVEWRSLNL